MSKGEIVEVVGLDAWGTIVNYDSSNKPDRDYICEPLTETLENLGVVFSSSDELVQRYSALKNTTEHMSEVTGRHIGGLERRLMLAMSFGVKAEDIDMGTFVKVSEEVERRQETVLPGLIEPELPEALAELHQRGIRIGLISNLGMISAGYMRRTFVETGVAPHLDYELYSDETGLCKPNPEMFKRLGQVAGCSLENILFIGDNANADYEGPRALGMQAYHIAPKGSDAEYHAPNVTSALAAAGLIG